MSETELSIVLDRSWTADQYALDSTQVLAKRGGGITTFGTCDITKEVKYPAWPSAAELQNHRNAAKVSSDQYWYRVKPGECGALASLYHDATFLRKPAVNEVNADHVCEYFLSSRG